MGYEVIKINDNTWRIEDNHIVWILELQNFYLIKNKVCAGREEGNLEI